MAYYMKGCALGQVGWLERAVEDFGRSTELDPENVECRRNRAILYREQGEPEKAIAEYDEIIRLEPGDPSVKEERRHAMDDAKQKER